MRSKIWVVCLIGLLLAGGLILISCDNRGCRGECYFNSLYDMEVYNCCLNDDGNKINAIYCGVAGAAYSNFLVTYYPQSSSCDSGCEGK